MYQVCCVSSAHERMSLLAIRSRQASGSILPHDRRNLLCPTPSRYVGRTLSASKEMCSLPYQIPLRARCFQPRSPPRLSSVMSSTKTYPICIGKAVRKPRRYAQGELLVAMSPHIGRDTQNIAHSRLGKRSSLFRPGDCSPTMPTWAAGGGQADLGRYT